MPSILLLGTCDTKLDQLLYLRSSILENFSNATDQQLDLILVDVGRKDVPESPEINITNQQLRSQYHPPEWTTDREALFAQPRGEWIRYMAGCARNYVEELKGKQQLHGAIGVGGSCGTSLAAEVMRDSFPLGFPKLIVSTIASGDTSAIVGETDITMMYSIVDIAANNQLLRNILSNAAGAIWGMASAYEAAQRTTALGKQPQSDGRTLQIGITMFGVTTPCVEAISEILRSKTHPSVEVYVFHATGSGGKAMERLIKEGKLDAVIDLTTTEICDELFGGNMSAGPARLEAAAKAGIPYLVSFGACDMVNFGPRGTVPEKYEKRQLYEHNSTVTLMRTSPEECRQIRQFIVDKLIRFSKTPKHVRVCVPLGGVSMISKPGDAFYSKEADKELFDLDGSGLKEHGIDVTFDDRDINHPGFSELVAQTFWDLLTNTLDGER